MIKTTKLFLLFLLLSASASAQDIEWLSPLTHDFGDLQQHVPDSTEFIWKNTTSDTLYIDNVRTTCGCTAPSWSYDPILPDSTTRIKVIYDAKRPGYFKKVVKVYISHQRQAVRLLIEGFVEEI